MQNGRTNQQRKHTETPQQGVVPRSNVDSGSVNSPAGTSKEMTLKAVKCFNCKKKGYIAKMCPEPRRKDATTVG